MNGSQQLRTAIYARTGSSQIYNSCQSQIEMLSRTVGLNANRSLAGIHWDEGKSCNADRPGLEELLQKCDEGMYDEILVLNLSRLDRDPWNLLQFTHRLDANHVRLTAVQEDTSAVLQSIGSVMKYG